MNIKFIDVDVSTAYEVIKENIYKCGTISKPVIDTKFHHETKIENVSKALKYGLLSKRRLAQLEGRNLTEKEIYLFSDESYVNGADNISLSSMELDFSENTKNQFCYNPYKPISADIIVSKEVKAIRNTQNYFNEFLVKNEISPNFFNAVDFRILSILDFDFYNEEQNLKENKIKLMLKYYSYLRTIALTLKETNLDIPLREVSDEVITLAPEKVMRLPYIYLN